MSVATERKPIEILLVEDSLTDRLITEHALAETSISNRLHMVDDGVKAMAFLRKEGVYADAPRPDLILLDLNMPRKNGLEVLAEIKADDDLRAIPVIILTTSSAEEDVIRSYRLYANSYISKPVGYEAFVKAVATLEDYWFSVATLPPQ